MWPARTTSAKSAAGLNLLTQEIHRDAQKVLAVSLPNKILVLNELIESASDPDSPLQAKAYLRDASVGIIENSSSGKKRKMSDSAQVIPSSSEAPATERKSRDSIRIVFDLVEKELTEFCTLVRTLKLSCSLKQYTSEHEIQQNEEFIAECASAFDRAQEALGGAVKYYTSRATWSAAYDQNPSVSDYAHAIYELDKNAIRNSLGALVHLLDVYFLLLDLFKKMPA